MDVVVNNVFHLLTLAKVRQGNYFSLDPVQYTMKRYSREHLLNHHNYAALLLKSSLVCFRQAAELFWASMQAIWWESLFQVLMMTVTVFYVYCTNQVSYDTSNHSTEEQKRSENVACVQILTMNSK